MSCLPDMYTLSPQSLGVHIRQTTCAHVTTITYNNNYVVSGENTSNVVVAFCLLSWDLLSYQKLIVLVMIFRKFLCGFTYIIIC